MPVLNVYILYAKYSKPVKVAKIWLDPKRLAGVPQPSDLPRAAEGTHWNSHHPSTTGEVGHGRRGCTNCDKSDVMKGLNVCGLCTQSHHPQVWACDWPSGTSIYWPSAFASGLATHPRNRFSSTGPARRSAGPGDRHRPMSSCAKQSLKSFNGARASVPWVWRRGRDDLTHSTHSAMPDGPKKPAISIVK